MYAQARSQWHGAVCSVEVFGAKQVVSATSSVILVEQVLQLTQDFAGPVYATSPWTPVVDVSTSQPTVPAQPPVPVVVSVTGGAVQLRLTPPLDTGGVDITGYRLELFNATGLTWDIVPNVGVDVGSVATVWLPGLKPQTKYRLRASALNSISTCSADVWMDGVTC